MKRQTTKLQKVFTKYISVSRIFKELLYDNDKTKKPNLTKDNIWMTNKHMRNCLTLHNS